VALSLSQEVSMLRLLTEKIGVDSAVAGQNHSPRAHYRVADSAVEEALRTALREDIPRPLAEIATHLGYRSVAPLQNRYRELCGQIISKRRFGLKSFPNPPSTPLPRERIEQALSEALNHDGPVSLHSVAAKIGLRNRRRLYKGFHDFRLAIAAKNKRFRKERVDAIEGALRAAFDETPVPTVTDVARRLGLRDVTRITRRFPDLSAALRRWRQAPSTA
jgi:AraC-like DNA-binding protein